MSEKSLNALYSKWRQQSIEIKSGELKEVYFDNTNPNMFFISNFNDVDIYGGLNRIPTAKNHEFIFKAHKQKPFGVPLGKRVLYLLNLSQENVIVDVYSTEMPFDLNVLHDFSVDNVTITADDPVSFELHGLNEGVVLPVVNDKETKDLLVNIKTSIDNSSNDDVVVALGKIKNDDVVQAINAKSNDDVVQAINDVKTVLSEADIMKLPDDLVIFETVGTTANKSCQRAYFVEIMFLKNDGNSDLELTMWQGDTTTKITVKPGEELKGIRYMTNTADNGFQVGAVDSAMRSYRLIARAKR